MSGESVDAATTAFKKALIERALDLEFHIRQSAHLADLQEQLYAPFETCWSATLHTLIGSAQQVNNQTGPLPLTTELLAPAEYWVFLNWILVANSRTRARDVDIVWLCSTMTA